MSPAAQLKTATLQKEIAPCWDPHARPDTVKILTPPPPAKYCFATHKEIYSVCAKSLCNPFNLSTVLRRVNLL